MKRMLVIMLLMGIQSVYVQAQVLPSVGTWGLRASIQVDSTVVMLPYRLNENTTISPLLGFEWIEDESTTILIGAHSQRYLNTSSRFANYIGFKAAALNISPDGGDSETNFLLGAFIGGDVFMSPRISVGVEAGFDLAIGSDQNALSTATSALLTYYF